MECRIPACEKPVRSRGLCSTHYTRQWMYGDPLIVHKTGVPATTDPCKVEGCGGKIRARRYCNKHYQQLAKRGQIYVSKLELSDCERFWQKVQKSDGCWVWTGNINKKNGTATRISAYTVKLD